MHALSAADLLAVWEQASGQHPLVRPLVVLAAAFPEVDTRTLAQEPLGTLHARLWQVRAALLGTALVGCADCPACGEQTQLELDASGLAQPTQTTDSGPVRALAMADLIAAAHEDNPTAALLTRCQTISAPIAEPAVELTNADPAAEVLLDLACPACGHEWAAPLDVGSFLWTELQRLVGDTVEDVDVLARCYGWSERDVLELSPARRRRYVEMARYGSAALP